MLEQIFIIKYLNVFKMFIFKCSMYYRYLTICLAVFFAKIKNEIKLLNKLQR